MPRKLVLYIATSLDGYIAQPNDDLSFLSMVQKEGEDYGYQAFISQVDTVILGRKTYDWVMGQVDAFPHADKETYVVTRSTRPAEGNVQFYSGDVPELVQRLKAADGKVIFCDGGAELVQVLLKHKLIDELIISVIPVMVGEGTRLFHDGRPYQLLQLESVQSFETGLVQLHYKAL
ncbi:MAG TPA: dihydrofolate reductase family protein [Saprospiraceae bacterium]|nr:dihydrofolate reductase family protein [Saprospiraceae bacterium]